MGRLTLEQAAAWCGGQIAEKNRNVTFFGANIDSRKLEPGQLFVAVQGQRDGHAYIGQAMARGAAAVLCQHCEGDYPAIVVEDPVRALGEIARQERRRIGMKVIGITGSVGKSSTKEMIARVVQTTYPTGKTPMNFNNNIGLPMTILGLPEDTQVAVLEMGMNHFREMAYLTSIAQPDIAVITNIGTMHIEHLGSMEGILRAKLEILEGMREDGKLILNGDDTLLWNLHRQSPLHTVYFGCQNQQCGVRGSEIVEGPGYLQFQVSVGNLSFPVEMPLEGRHFVYDALLAIAVGIELKVDPARIQEALSEFQNMAGRQEIFEAQGMTIIKDCYNAGPESMAAALTVLGNRPGRRIAVLGDMLELGVCTQAEHYRVGRIAVEKADLVFAYGPNSGRVVNGALTGGMPESKAQSFQTQQELVAALVRAARPGDVLLFKGSRGMHMELALEQFLQELALVPGDGVSRNEP